MADARTDAIRAEIERLRELITKYCDRYTSHWTTRLEGRITALGWVLDISDPPDRRDEAMRRARDAFAILACERGVSEVKCAPSNVILPPEFEPFARPILDAAMKPQGPSND